MNRKGSKKNIKLDKTTEEENQKNENNDLINPDDFLQKHIF